MVNATLPPEPAVSLVIPAYREAQRLPRTMRELARWCGDFTGTLEVLIVVERGTDGTLELAREIAREIAGEQAHSLVRWEVIDNGPQRGKGHAVRSGMRRARGAVVFYMDVDLSVPLREVGAFLERFEREAGVDVLIGNRQHARSQITRAQSWLRRSMGQVFNRVLGALALTRWRDTQCGFKAFRQGACREVFARQTVEGFAFDVEVLLLAEGLGFRVEDAPVEWVNSAESKVRIVRDSWRMLRDAARVRRGVERALAGRADQGAEHSARSRRISTP